ncbi:flagellar motor protein MotB [bacterium AH-315-K03]|nr:flagellar motor protein MotB [bacterium AH-315-K03]
MADEEANCPECPPPGAPGWMGTFADLMSLLMCFFVLLLSFAEMDAMKFKRLAGSMAQAFGVQSKMKFKDPPKGTSIIAQEFSPGRPDPTPISEIYQHTDDLTELSLEVECAQEYDVESGVEDDEAAVEKDAKVVKEVEKLIKETQKDAADIAEALSQQIVSGQVEIETTGRQIIVRIREKGSFGSGSATLSAQYIPVLHEVRDILATKDGSISVQGHTDNIPINTSRFRSNWELSTGRAVSVAHELLNDGVLNPARIQVSGFSDTQPVASNETSPGRSKNRRVEIIIQQGIGEGVKESLQALKKDNPDLYQSLDLKKETIFDLDSNEIF